MHDSAFNLSRLVNHMAVDPSQSPLNRLVGRSVFAGVVFNGPMRKCKGAIKEKTLAKDGTRITAKNGAKRSCVSLGEQRVYHEHAHATLQ